MIEPWLPLPNVNDRFALDELREDSDGLFITLQNESERSLRIDVAAPIAYRSELRELRESQWSRLESESGCRALWEVKGSAWSRELGVESAYHYLVLTDDEVVEFLTEQAPHISWLDNFFGDAV